MAIHAATAAMNQTLPNAEIGIAALLLNEKPPCSSATT
jgi:hypothetical protein